MSDRVETYAGTVMPWWAGKSATARSMDVINDGRETVPGPELFERAGLAGWNVTKTPLFITGSHAQQIPGWRATIRSTDGQYLGLVTDSYHIVQNEEMKALADAIVGEGMGAQYVTAGSLMDGRVVWMTLKLDRDTIRIKGDPSPIDLFLLVSTGHDGRHALGANVTPVRTVCWNTLTEGRQQAKASIYLRHTSKVMDRYEDARKALGIVPKAAERFVGMMNALTGKPMTINDVLAFTEKLIPTNPEAERPFRTEAQRAELVKVYRDSPLLDGVGENAYRLYNAVAEWTDHVRPYSDGKYTSGDDKRATSIIDGWAASKKAKALTLLGV